jgi:hypothetical protein
MIMPAITSDRIKFLLSECDKEAEAEALARQNIDEQQALQDAEPGYGKWHQNVTTPPTPTRPGWIVS